MKAKTEDAKPTRRGFLEVPPAWARLPAGAALVQAAKARQFEIRRTAG